ncbi:UvrD-helicase domain-containing protein [Paenibacillus solani]|uniref:UvrD-helicase domain-containing protein n=1 Tax=Paenibacillus solani TaxID=1705565 RepID=UPI003D279D17
MLSISIEDHEIELVERVLLPAGESFDDQRRAVIRCLESKDVQACPGSGKTTALLAKLSILSQKLPLKNNKGICVLTHTNVAVNEIRERLDDKAEILFKYPNHFGTIQSFVNKFLAIPAYIKKFGKRPARIDNEIHREFLERKKRTLSRGTQSYLERNNIYLPDLKFSLSDFNVISKTLDGTYFVGPTTPTYLNVKSLKEEVLNEGILCYDDAYSLAYWYLREFPNLRDLISERFAYVFIDEMQDTDTKQQDILDRAFDNSKVIIQRIGDSNQAIYNSSWQIQTNHLSISDSKRFSPMIAERVKKICPTPQNLRGNPAVPNISPKLIVFDDATISQVIPKFGDLIFEKDLHRTDKKIFKAVGWVSKPNSRHTIPSYFNSYGKLGGKQKQDYESLLDYIKVANDNRRDSIAELQKILIRAILKCLRILGIRRANRVHFTEASFNELLSNEHKVLHDDLKLKLIQWCQQLHRNQDISGDIRTFISGRVCPQFGVAIRPELQLFLDAPAAIQLAPEQKEDTYVHEREAQKIIIDICTVHSVKGETHTATLYLETFYRQYDIQSIMGYLKGNHTPPRGATLQSSLKMAYVGMTRPTHMLCVAAHKDGCEQHLEELAAVGWDIHRIFKV